LRAFFEIVKLRASFVAAGDLLMPEARLRRVSSQRFQSAFRLIAVALCATAFLLPAAQATSAKKSESSTTASKQKDKSVATKASSSKAASTKVAQSAKADRSVRGGRNVVATIRTRNGKTIVAVQRHSVVRVAEVAPPKLSFGQMAGLHSQDELDLKSSVALVIDQDTREVLFSKNDHAVLPIASLTKLMTGLLIS
jgi:D-alanyl-D-alanine endopeptidase (penicillin-binding protein 7)